MRAVHSCKCWLIYLFWYILETWKDLVSKVQQYQRFYYIIMLTLCWDNKIKIGRQVNKERNRHARKPPYIRTNTKVLINNYLERIWWQKFTSKFISKFTSKFISKQKRTKSMQGLRASLTASQLSVSLYSSMWSTEARLNFNFSISNRTTLEQLCHFYLYLGYRTSWRLETWSNSSSYPKHHHGTREIW